ncbi:hypothetical protein B0J13DRAFT_483437 [Dactylonectria estremocensis]|uniref:Cellulose-binding protein n=1 Tax=Dactylonectria estremocensis TaxID=1079267 RepID=A0A9P9IMH1_9HYPO|nr:hypothetical protein B0J13DRAFT_483437 [Dactylonectria estremocensis]
MSVNLSSLATFGSKPRIFILTDVLNEPDDSQSLVRYLLYANEFDTRGICATTSTWLRSSTHPEELRRIINAYGKVVKNLNNHVHPEFQYSSAEHFLSLVTAGPNVYGKKAFKEPLSEGAQRLLDVLEESEEALYIPVWGGVNTLAQALKHLSETASPEEAAKQRAKLRVYTISDQDDAGAWIRGKFPDVFYIASVHGWNQYGQGSWLGMNIGAGPGADPTKVLNPWLTEHIRVGEFGAEAYPLVKFGMEGDTPSFLWLVQNGLSHGDNINWGGWGGRYLRPQGEADWEDGIDQNHFYNVSEAAVIGKDGKRYSDHKASIWRWRDAVQDDFAARMQWTLTSNFAEAKHPPIVDVNGHKGVEPLILKVNPGETHVLDASGTYNPDGDSDLEYIWMLYPDINGFHTLGGGPKVDIEAVEKPSSERKIADNFAGFANYTRGRKVKVTAAKRERNPQTGLATPDFHVLLQVTNTAGPYPIRRYKRVIFSYLDGLPIPMGKIPEGFSSDT